MNREERSNTQSSALNSTPKWWGPLLVSISAVLFAGMAVLVRLAGYHHIPGSQTTLIRFASGFLVVVAMHYLGLTRFVIRRRALLAARGLSGGLAILFYFLSLAAAGRGETTLTNSVLLGNSYFVFAPIFASLLIKEKLRGGVLAAVAVAFAGIYLVINPQFGGIRVADIYALASGVLAGLAVVIIKELRRTEPAPVIFLSLCVFGAILAAVTLPIEGAIWPDAIGWIILAAMAVLSTAGQLLLTHAFRFVPAAEGSLFAMTAVVYASLAGIFLFKEPFTTRLGAGAALVFASAIYLAFTYEEKTGA